MQPATAPNWPEERAQLRAELGARVKTLRLAARLTLEAAAAASGLALSTIHKIENGRVSPSFENLLRLARAYGVGIEQLVAPQAAPSPSTRLTVTRAGLGQKLRVQNYEHELLCNALAEKKILPLITTVERCEALALHDLEAHPGEELIFVLSGAVELVAEKYQPVVLEAGDCAYFDSTIRHGLRKIGADEARVFWASTSLDFTS